MIRRLLKDQRGTAVLLALGFMIFLLAMVGFAVDISYQMAAIGELERSMEAAALAGAARLGFNDTVFPTVRDTARQYGQLNPHHNPPFGNLINLDLNSGNAPDGNIVLGVWQNNNFNPSLDGTVVNAVRCQFASQVQTSFLRVLGISTLPISASAIALANPPLNPPPQTCMFPLGLSSCFFGGATSLGCGSTVTFTSSSDQSAVGANTAAWVGMFPTCPTSDGRPCDSNINANETSQAVDQAANPGAGGCSSVLQNGDSVATNNGMQASVFNQHVIPAFVNKYNSSSTLTVLKADGSVAYEGRGWEVFVPVIDTGPTCPPGAVNGSKQIVGFTRFVITQVRNNNGECAVANHYAGNPWDPKCYTNKNGTATDLSPGDTGSRGIYGYYDCTYYPSNPTPEPVPRTALATRLRLVKMYR
jgi:hypothetical protein